MANIEKRWTKFHYVQSPSSFCNIFGVNKQKAWQHGATLFVFYGFMTHHPVKR